MTPSYSANRRLATPLIKKAYPGFTDTATLR